MAIFTDPLTAGEITRPWYLIEMRLGFETIRASTGAPADFDGVTFEAGVIDESVGFQIGQDTLRIGILNTDNQRTLQALRNEFLGGEITVWYAPSPSDPNYFFEPGYVDEGYEEPRTPANPQIVFAGTITEITRADAALEVVSSKQQIGGFPRIRVNTPLANFTARSGTVITLAGKTITVTQRSY